ncbi:MAG: hypothetical protein SGILL_002590, partial [Bacillariaceae sp.]
ADPFRRPKCDDKQCESIVCTLRPECCDTAYDEQCVNLALKHCELPDPENLCYVESIVPGCVDNQCLDAVCEIDGTCCSGAYTNKCVDIAKQNARSCPPPEIGNTCFQESPFGGCSDPRCAELVCEISEGCCNGDTVGEWSSLCVGAAEELCQPEVLLRPYGECPFGMTCDLAFMSNCTELAAQYKDVFEVGDVYGGMYCGNNESDTIQNCPRGMYCPDPETMLLCPAGFYCPYKTSRPTIRCKHCKEGATELTQDVYGYIILSIIVFVVVIYIAWGVLQRYNKRLADRIHKRKEPASPGPFLRTLNAASPGHARKHSWGSSSGHVRKNSWGSSASGHVRKNSAPGHVRKNSAPGHVRKNSWGSSAAGHVRKNSWGASPGHVRKQSTGNGLEFIGDDIKFDARRVFDILDADASGDVSFEELNVILGFNESEMREFIRRMNEMAGSTSNKDSVTRPVFVKYFLQALLETSNLTISFEEAEALFDEMSGGAKDKKEINMNKFYTSSMSDFFI